MRFKHAFHVLVDNFAATFKLLVYKIIIIAITVGLACAIIIPTMHNVLSAAQHKELTDTITSFLKNVVALNFGGIRSDFNSLYTSLSELKVLISDKSNVLIGAGAGIAGVALVYKYLSGLGNYTMGALINDKMTLQAKSSFTLTMLKNLGKSCTYSAIYAPLAWIYDMIGFGIIWAVVFKGLKFMHIPLVKLFLIAVLVVLLYTVKLVFTADWLPSLVHGQKTNGKAMRYSFSRKGKDTAAVFSTGLVLILIIIAINVAALFFTFGAGILITIPGCYLAVISFEFANYFDSNKLKYFVDEYTIIGPQKETPLTREEFFKGEE